MAYLEEAQRLGLRVVLNLLPPEAMVEPSCLTQRGRRGCPFSLAAFAASLEAYRGMDVANDNGTFYAHMLMDEPFDPTNWGGRPISYEELRAASERSHALLGNVPTAVNAGYVPPTFQPHVVDMVMSTFYRNKERKFGSLDVYLKEQLANLTPARRAQPDLRYVLLLQAVGGGAFGPFPRPEEMEIQALKACEQEGVDGIFWWTWTKPQVTDLSLVMRGPQGDAYRAMISRVVTACAGR